MKKLLLLSSVALVLAACGDSRPPQTAQTAAQVRAAVQGSTASIPGFRSNYTITRNDDKTITVLRLLDNVPQVLPATVTLVRFQDMYVSFDVEGLTGQAYRMYQAALNRKPDEAGLGFWINAMQAGYSLQDVADFFYNSPEFQTTYGKLSDAAFVDQIYKNVLRRAPEASGRDWWLNVMANGITRAGVLRGFSESQENKDNLAADIRNGMPYLPSGGSALQVPVQTFTTPAVSKPAAATPVSTALADVIGTYKRLPVENGYHTGQISLKAGSTTVLQWKNESGVSWDLTPDLADGALNTGPTNPYYTSVDGKAFLLAYVNGKLAGFYFSREFYARDGVPLPAGVTPNLRTMVESTSGLHGYFYHQMSPVPSDYGYGFSMYVAMWPFVDKATDYFQAGVGTFVQPINDDATQPLLPPDNQMRISTPGGAATNWANLFQTIEGGMGTWGALQFPVRDPKFHIVGTTNGYSSGVGSPGWPFKDTQQTSLTAEEMSVAQLSNRILTAPDGFTFKSGTNGEFLGYGWMALPLTEARTNIVPIGDQSWTLFFNASNFAGPVAFWVPDAWTRLSRTWAPAVGRGEDARPAHFDSTVFEFGNIPTFANGDAGGNLYVRGPRVLFPVDANNMTYLSADWHKYSKDAIFNPMRSWFKGGASFSGTFDATAAMLPTLSEPGIGWDYGYGTDTVNQVEGLSRFVTPEVFKTPGGGQAFGLKWTGVGTPGVMPEYFKRTGSTMTPLLASEVPSETAFGTTSFVEPVRGKTFTSTASWMTPAPVAGPFTAKLSDGSMVTYYWYRFIDQPALQNFGWSAAEKAQLQARVEMIHRNWSGTREFIPPPTAGTLATLDSGQFVTPPTGYEIGYVPIVTRQEKAK